MILNYFTSLQSQKDTNKVYYLKVALNSSCVRTIYNSTFSSLNWTLKFESSSIIKCCQPLKIFTIDQKRRKIISTTATTQQQHNNNTEKNDFFIHCNLRQLKICQFAGKYLLVFQFNKKCWPLYNEEILSTGPGGSYVLCLFQKINLLKGPFDSDLVLVNLDFVPHAKKFQHNLGLRLRTQ